MNYELHPDIDKIFKKLSIKDKPLLNIILNKINDIINCEDINHYKNLRHPMNKYKRVHITQKFVLIFRYLEKNDVIIFRYFDHRNNVYKNKFD